MPAPSDVRFQIAVTDARLQCAALIPLGASMLTGSNVALRFAGIHEDVNAPRGHDAVKLLLLAMSQVEDAVKIHRLGAAPDIVVGSAGAVTETGVAQKVLADLADGAPSATNPFLVFNGEKSDRVTALLLCETIAR